MPLFVCCRFVSHSEAVEEVYEIGNPVVAAKKLQDLAQGYGSKENIGVLVIRLNTDRGPSLGRLRQYKSVLLNEIERFYSLKQSFVVQVDVDRRRPSSAGTRRATSAGAPTSTRITSEPATERAATQTQSQKQGSRSVSSVQTKRQANPVPRASSQSNSVIHRCDGDVSERVDSAQSRFVERRRRRRASGPEAAAQPEVSGET